MPTMTATRHETPPTTTTDRMSQPQEKGARVDRIEHSAQKPSPKAGLYAAIGCLAVLVGLLVPATAALATGPPHFDPRELAEELHATRVAIEPELEPEGLPTEWRAEYAPAENGKEPLPPLKPGEAPWTVTASGTTLGGDSGSARLYIGAAAGTAGNNVRYLRHLAPKTPYYARFLAENADNKGEPAIEEVPFITLSAGNPEIPQIGGTIPPKSGSTFELHRVLTSREAGLIAQVETDGAETTYSFGYAPAEINGQPPLPESLAWQLCSSGATGTVSVIEEFADPEALCTGLIPETSYFARVRATNHCNVAKPAEECTVEELLAFRTATAKPVVLEPEVRNATAVSAHLSGQVVPHGSQTEWRLEWSASKKALEGGKGTVAAAGTISKAQAEALPFDSGVAVEGELTGLEPSSVYYVRLFAENLCAAGCGSASSEIASFETSGPPSASTFAVHALHGESMRLLGAVNPRSVPTSEEQRITIEGASAGSFTLTFKGQSTGAISFDAPAEGPGGVRKALSDLPGAPEVSVTGLAGGPYTVLFLGKNVQGVQPQIVCDASGLEPKPPAATCTVVTTQQGGEAYDTHYHFQYVSQKQFGETGWAGAGETREVDVGSGDVFKSVGEDLPELQPGETYRYRMLATNTSPGNPVVDGAEQTLTVPTPAPVGAPAACPNEALRSGPSANLPDCRAYEQLTPVHKEGSQEPFSWSGLTEASAEAGEDGEHFVLDEPALSWGSGPHAGNSPYFFSREEGKGWDMTAAASQPEFGVHSLTPQVFDPNLTGLGFESASTVRTEDIAFEAGPLEGPYTTVASVPRKQVQAGLGWVAASGDFSKLILAKAGNLYEYSGGELRQLNVGIGACGVRIAHGAEQGAALVARGGPHSLSHDGLRVFFEAVPGCSGPTHTFIRLDGTETVDLGAVSFLAANEDGSEVLLEKSGGETHEVLLYDTQTATETKLFSVHGDRINESRYELHVSAGPHLSALYFASSEQLTPGAPSVSPSQSGVSDLYRYDIPGRALSFLLQATSAPNLSLISSVSPDGRYAYFGAEAIGGLPGGGIVPEGVTKGLTAPQVYRYDSAEELVQCVSCASSFDHEPRLASVLYASDGHFFEKGGLPSYTAVSANGDFAFFTTPAALLPSDVDGEVAREGGTPGEEGPGRGEFADKGQFTSPSSDIYEWRRDGLDGCTHLNGCLALISNGRGGFLTLLLGSAHEGRDVFIYTSSQLLPQDRDTAGDIYDARIGGGFPSPPPEVLGCEGDACSTPPPAPIDSTPASLSFSGPGNLAPQSKPKSKVKHKPKRKARKLRSKKHGGKVGRKVKNSNRRGGG